MLREHPSKRRKITTPKLRVHLETREETLALGTIIWIQIGANYVEIYRGRGPRVSVSPSTKMSLTKEGKSAEPSFLVYMGSGLKVLLGGWSL